ncbi:MAG: D-alanyl-D-alanine carboxypeptidase family protein, partial [Proteobacteria bacterium]|nr:D-alanyl-D-alanine carboxypeptidase family protein [Pseudomonadota bacterium]
MELAKSKKTLASSSLTSSLSRSSTPNRLLQSIQARTGNSKPAASSGGSSIVKQNDPICTVTVTCGALNVRDGASVESQRIGGVTQGKQLNVYEVQNGWLKIGYGTGFGWVCAKYTTYQEPTTTGTETPAPADPTPTDPPPADPTPTDPEPEPTTPENPSVAVDPSEVGDTGKDYGTLKKGSKGEGVVVLQKYLNKYLGHYSHLTPLDTDGSFGSQTFIRLSYYQYSRNIQGSGGIDVDGVCGPASWKTLRSSAPEVYNITEPKSWSSLKCNGSYTGTSIKGGGTMRSDAAAAYDKMYDAAKADGHTLNTSSTYRGMTNKETSIGSNGGGNSGQIELFDEWDGNTKYCAKPGRSNHQTGIAADISGLKRENDTSDKFKWLQNNAKKFGFKNYTAECWHWDYKPNE